MMKVFSRRHFFFWFFPWLLVILCVQISIANIGTPILKWQYGGCYSSWCETGWYSSAAVCDLDGDGKAEVIGSAYSIVVLDGATGTIKWRVKSGYDRNTDPGSVSNVGRTWPGVVVADVDADGQLEIVTAHGGGYISVYNSQGYFEQGWPKRTATYEMRSLAVEDLDGDGDMEILAGLARLQRQNVWVFEHSGQLHPGWPQLVDDEGSAAGIYNDNIGVGDLDRDGLPEVIVPSDTITICAYRQDGTQLSTNQIYHDHPGHDMDLWSEVPAYVELEYEIRGWGPCYDEPTYRANFASGPANVVDMIGDGTFQVVVTGNVHDCNTSPYTDMYITPYIFNMDRTRFNANGWDWIIPPLYTGAPLTQDYGIIENAQPNPVTVDLDGDGVFEIIFASYDGRVHAFWLDGTEHGNWPFSVYNSRDGYFSFASEPVVADLDDDGHAEVIFASWVQKDTYATGHVYILDCQGNLVSKVQLPIAYSGTWNGVLAAPTLADIDGDPDLELVLNTAHSGLVAYDLPGTQGARILWATGRGNYKRTGSFETLKGDLDRDRDVDGSDILYFAISWHGQAKRADLDLDGEIDTEDLEVFCNSAGRLYARDP